MWHERLPRIQLMKVNIKWLGNFTGVTLEVLVSQELEWNIFVLDHMSFWTWQPPSYKPNCKTPYHGRTILKEQKNDANKAASFLTTHICTIRPLHSSLSSDCALIHCIHYRFPAPKATFTLFMKVPCIKPLSTCAIIQSSSILSMFPYHHKTLRSTCLPTLSITALLCSSSFLKLHSVHAMLSVTAHVTL